MVLSNSLFDGNVLAGEYQLVVTNVPYLARGKHGDTLMAFADLCAPEAKADLTTIFIDRCQKFSTTNGVAALVTPQNWLFLTSYTHFRKRMLTEACWEFVARLGEHGFESSQAVGAFTALVVVCKHPPAPDHSFPGADVASDNTPTAKQHRLRTDPITSVSQSAQLQNPDARISIFKLAGGKLLSTLA